MLFAALRFYKDENICDKLYWYRAPFCVKAGEKVFAPVGMRNRLQKAIVERIMETDGEHAPYDIRFIKDIESLCETKSFSLGGSICTDLGGVRYDDRHYTSFNRIAVCPKEELSAEDLCAAHASGFDEIVFIGDCAPLNGKRILLVGNNALEFARKIIWAARGREQGVPFETLAALLKGNG